MSRPPIVTRPWICRLLFIALLPLGARAQTPDYDARARAVVAKMTLDEKISQMHGFETKKIFRIVIGVPRLGIPDLLVTNGPAGFGPAGPGHDGKATALPAPISLAATWDLDASRQYGALAASEAAHAGNNFFESPDVNIARVPQNGRTFEAYGEDPYLVGRLAVANIEGIQSAGILANVKHFAANNQEAYRHTVNELIDERTLREIYFPAFEASVKEGHVATVMSAYNKINGVFCSEDAFLLKQVLRDEWGFKGFVTSDFHAVRSTVPSVMNGLDVEMPDARYFGESLKAAVLNGVVPISVIDEHLVCRFRTMMEYGIWDHPPVRKPIPVVADGVLARQWAEEGMVLLRNEDSILPLKAASLKSVALIGPYAAWVSTGGGGSSKVNPAYTVTPLDGFKKRLGPAVSVTLYSGSNLKTAAADAAAADVAIVEVGQIQTEGKDNSISLSGTAKELVERGIPPASRKAQNKASPSPTPIQMNQDALVEAVAAANPRTIVVVKSGGPVLMPWVDKVPAIVEAWYPGEEDGNAVAAVLMGDYNPCGKLPITFPKRIADTPAGTPEQYPGIASGVYSPKDFAPYPTPRAKATPVPADTPTPAATPLPYSMVRITARYSEGVLVGYRWYDARHIEPLFPFGFGLSYTTFSYSNLKLSSSTLSTDAPSLTVEFDVTNTGKMDGTEIAQVYVGIPPLSGVIEPPRQLKGFARLTIPAGGTAHATVTLDPRAFSYWNTGEHGWRVAKGEYPITVGASSRDLRLMGSVTVQ